MKKQKFVKVLGLTAIILTMASSALAELCTVGRNTQVLWKGDWYKAKITEANPDKCKITYIGYTSADDEWVGPERLKIKVLWKGDWYPARVLKKDGANYQIRYDGYGSDDDEIVPLSRIQIR